MHHKKSAALVEVHRTQETFLTADGRKAGRKSNGAVANYDFVSAQFRMEGDQRALSDRPMCFHGSFASQMGCSTARDTPGQSLLSPSSTSPTGCSPLNPLISSRVFGSTAIDSVGGTTRQTDEQSELCYLALNPVYESSFFLCPKRDTSTSTTITRRWLPISLEGKRRDGHGHQTSTDNKTSHRPDQHGQKKGRSLVQTLAKDESVGTVPSPIR